MIFTKHYYTKNVGHTWKCFGCYFDGLIKDMYAVDFDVFWTKQVLTYRSSSNNNLFAKTEASKIPHFEEKY